MRRGAGQAGFARASTRLAVLAVVAATMMVLFRAGTAHAHQSPDGCNSNSVDITPTRDRLLVRNGDVITYTVSLKNVDVGDQAACDVSNATVSLTLPAADGTPTGRKVVLDSNTDIPAGTSKVYPNKITYTVAVNPGVKDAVVLAQVDGTLHDAPVDHAASIRKTLGTTVTQPHTTLSVTASPKTGRAPLDVTYTYTEKNDSSTDVPITGVALTDSNCAPVTYQSGDTNSDQVLGTGEVWTYLCHKRISSGGAVTSNVVAKGTSKVDNRAAPDELTAVTVDVAQPHARLTKTAAPTSGPVPLLATYTYHYVNDGRDAIGALKVVDDNCAPVTITGGDANRNNLVDPGETWSFTCSRTFTTAGSFPNTATATGTDMVDHAPVPPLTATAHVDATPTATTTSSSPSTTTSAAPPPESGSDTAGGTPATVLARPPITRTRTPRRTGFLPVTGRSVLLLAAAALVLAGLGVVLTRMRSGGR